MERKIRGQVFESDIFAKRQQSIQFLTDAGSQIKPTVQRVDLGANTISQGRLIESSINSLTEPYHVRISSRKNRVPGSLPIDAIKSKKVTGGVFGKMKRQVSEASCSFHAYSDLKSAEPEVTHQT